MLKCENLQVGHSFNNILIQNVNFDLSLSENSNKIVIILGENGCGKTTLLKTLSTLIPPLSGRLTMHDLSLVGYLNAETLHLFSHLKGSEIVDFFEQLHGSRILAAFYDNELFIQILKTQYSQMSSGMKQILKLSISITNNKKIVFWDEPFKSLSEINKVIVGELIETLSKNHLFILTSHERISWNLNHLKLFKIIDKQLVIVDDL